MAKRNPENLYQTVNFHFRVGFRLGTETFDMRFQSVTGLDATLETESIREGGENRYEHVVPVRRKYGPLVLKRGLLSPTESGLTAWFKEAFDDEKVTPIPDVDIMLLNEESQPLMYWTVNNVWPRSWKIGELNAERGEVLIETLELNYNRLLFHE
ncbi:phage tail protein [Pontibacter russatus]|uniref:phage tail protein n=1 Tax=Pontibacter russatus TaxID=2694929 RepID=UPI00137AB8A9|nr:phage tail protein [Pontibacter russatus]